VSAGVARAKLEPLYDIDPRTGVTIEVFYADRALETFGWGGGGWFWHARRRGFAPDGLAHRPFPTSYTSCRDMLGTLNYPTQFGKRSERDHASKRRP
jgi:hypothetical protein